MARSNKPFSVGYGKPPDKTRFQKGKSGNPRGRPKGSRNFASLVRAELDRKVVITEGGRRLKVSKREVITKQQVNRAVAGDLKSTELLMRVEALAGAGEMAPAADLAADREVMALLLAQVRRAKSTDSDSDPTDDDPNLRDEDPNPEE